MSFMKRYAFRAVYSAPGAGGSGGGTGDVTGNEPGQKTAEEIAAEETARKAAEAAAKNPTKTFTQEDVDKLISDRLKREQDKAAKDALAKQGEFQKLYEEAKPKLESLESELTATKAERDSLSAIVKKTIEGTITDWPAEIKDLYDAELSPEKQLQWIEKMKPVVAKLSGTTGTTKPPKVNGENGPRGNENKTARPEETYLSSRYGTSLPSNAK